MTHSMQKFHSYNFDMRKGPISIKWFEGARTNLCYNCVDRHVAGGKKDKVALIWEGNDLGVQGTWTYQELQEQVGLTSDGSLFSMDDVMAAAMVISASSMDGVSSLCHCSSVER